MSCGLLVYDEEQFCIHYDGLACDDGLVCNYHDELVYHNELHLHKLRQLHILNLYQHSMLLFEFFHQEEVRDKILGCCIHL